MQRNLFAAMLGVMILSILAASFFLVPKILPLGFLQPATVPLPTIVPDPTRAVTPTPTPTNTPTTDATVTSIRLVSTYLVDATTGKVLINVDSTHRLPMASTTKIMTAILALEHLDLNDQQTIDQSELDEVPADGGYTTAFLHVNDQLSVQSLLYGLLLPSGCDAAIVLAHAVSGDSAHFVTLMNAKARELHLNNTHFANPAGFSDPNNYSTAADLTTLARYAMSNPTFAQIVSQPTHTVDATLYRHRYDWENTNQLLNLYPGANGLKTGNSDDSGYCLVFSALRKGHLLIGTVMHDTSDWLYQDAMSALDTGFAQV